MESLPLTTSINHNHGWQSASPTPPKLPYSTIISEDNPETPSNSSLSSESPEPISLPWRRQITKNHSTPRANTVACLPMCAQALVHASGGIRKWYVVRASVGNPLQYIMAHVLDRTKQSSHFLTPILSANAVYYIWFLCWL